MLRKKILICIFTIFSIFSYSSNFKSNDEYNKSIGIVKSVMSKYAYDKKEISEKLGSDIVDKYLETLDYNKMYFTKEELKPLLDIKNIYASLTDESFMENGFIIYNSYLKNVDFYYNYAISLVKDYKFDFNEDENISFRRNKGDFEKNVDDLKKQWYKKVKNDILRLKLDGKADDEIKKILIKRYDSNRKNLLNVKQDDVAQFIITSYSESVDPHSSYYTPENAKEYLDDLALSLVGMGATIERRGDVNVIKELIKGGPAEKSGLFNIGDIFISVGQGKDGEMEDVRHITLKELVKRIRGDKGTLVRIGVARTEDSPVRIIPIIREEINLEDKRIKVNEYYEDNKKITYIKIPSFYSKTSQKKGHNVSDDFREALIKANKNNSKSLVIDLRDNGGGSLNEVIKMIGYMIGKDKVAVQVLTGDNKVLKNETNTNILTRLPVVVMINKYSASASEIFAGAIKDYNRGIVVGSVSWGKGTVQTLSSLIHDGMIKLTTQMFFRVNGSSTQLLGVTPDITFHEYYSDDLGEKQYKNALNWRKVKNELKYDFGAKKNIENILKNHNERIKNNDAWKIYMDEKKYVFSLSERKNISLNLNERLKEREKQLNKREYFIKEFKKNGLSTVKIFEVDNGLASNEEDLKEALKKKKERENLVDEEMKEAFRISLEIK